jgi:hypothetical protein
VDQGEQKVIYKDAQIVGYEEDGILRVFGVASASEAEQALADYSGDWRMQEQIYLNPEEFPVSTEEPPEPEPDPHGTKSARRRRQPIAYDPAIDYPEWQECEHDAPGAQRGWRLLNTTMPDLFNGGTDEDWFPNPLHQAEQTD